MQHGASWQSTAAPVKKSRRVMLQTVKSSKHYCATASHNIAMPPPAPSPAPAWRRGADVLLFSFTAAIYLNSLKGALVFDDRLAIVENKVCALLLLMISMGVLIDQGCGLQQVERD